MTTQGVRAGNIGPDSQVVKRNALPEVPKAVALPSGQQRSTDAHLEI